MVTTSLNVECKKVKASRFVILQQVHIAFINEQLLAECSRDEGVDLLAGAVCEPFHARVDARIGPEQRRTAEEDV